MVQSPKTENIQQVEIVNKHGARKTIFIVLGILFAGCLTMLLPGILFFMVLGVLISPDSSQESKYKETVIEHGSANSRVAVIHVNGEIVSDNDFGGDLLQQAPSGRIVRELKQADEDSTVKAVIMHVNSPGGSVVPSRKIYDQVKKVKQNKKIYVVMEDLAASGGYYISAPADKIFAGPDTFTGSIGVILQIPNLSGLLNKVGVSFKTFKSGKHKDIGSSYRVADVEEEQILQSIVDEAFNDFKKAVVDGRGLTEADLSGIDDGRVLTGRQALAKKLVDDLGGRDEAVTQATKDLGLTDPELFEYASPGFFDSLLGVKSNILKLFSGTTIVKPQLMYLWSPGA